MLIPTPQPPTTGFAPSYWQEPKHALDDQRTTEKLLSTCDVVVIGAGYAGIATAYHLTSISQAANTEKVNVVLLEARGLCSGASGRNDRYGGISRFIKRSGREAGAEISRFEIAQMHELHDFVKAKGIDCDFTMTRCCDVFCNAEAAETARIGHEYMTQQRLDFIDDDVVFTMGPEALKISGVKDAKACITYTGGTVHPYKFLMGVLSLALSSGHLNAQPHTPVTAVTEVADPIYKYRVETARGIIKAKKVIHATNGFLPVLLPQYKHSIVACRGFCSHISAPKNDAPVRPPRLTQSYIVRTADGVGLEYLIPRPDGSIVVGGGGPAFHPDRSTWVGNVRDDLVTDAIREHFRGYMQRTFAGWEDSGAEVDHIWSGVMGYSTDSHPHIGAVVWPDDDIDDNAATTLSDPSALYSSHAHEPTLIHGSPGHSQGQFINAGFNGHGMPVIWRTSRAVAEMVLLGRAFDATGVPRLFESTPARLHAARAGPEGGDIFHKEGVTVADLLVGGGGGGGDGGVRLERQQQEHEQQHEHEQVVVDMGVHEGKAVS